jgi:hypothetical protein
VGIALPSATPTARRLGDATKVRADILAAQSEIDGMTKPSKSGKNVFVSNADWKRVSNMTKGCLALKTNVSELQKQVDDLRRDRDNWKENYTRLWRDVKDFIKAIRTIPSRLLGSASLRPRHAKNWPKSLSRFRRNR